MKTSMTKFAEKPQTPVSPHPSHQLWSNPKATHAAIQFAAQDYSVMEMDGGFESWKENGLKNAK